MEGQMTLQMKKKRVYYRICDKCKNKVENFNGKMRFRQTTRSLKRAVVMTSKKVWLCNVCIKVVDVKEVED